MGLRLGPKTIQFASPPNILSFASVAGKAEKDGAYGLCFDLTFDDGLWVKKHMSSRKEKCLKGR
jgi:hypothetical protein